jgi:hypothetical protein
MRRAEYGAIITAILFVGTMTTVGLWFGPGDVWHRIKDLSPLRSPDCWGFH